LPNHHLCQTEKVAMPPPCQHQNLRLTIEQCLISTPKTTVKIKI